MHPSNPDASSDFDRAPSPYAFDDEQSYDEDGQARWGGTGQGAPLDENGRYIYSQAGMPVVPSLPPSPTSSPEIVLVSLPGGATPHNEAGAGKTITTDNNVNPPTLKRQWSDEQPRTPRHNFGALTNTNRANSVPIQPSRPIKRRRLRSPFDFRSESSRNENSLEVVMKELQCNLSKQTEILAAILETLQERDAKS